MRYELEGYGDENGESREVGNDEYWNCFDLCNVCLSHDLTMISDGRLSVRRASRPSKSLVLDCQKSASEPIRCCE